MDKERVKGKQYEGGKVRGVSSVDGKGGGKGRGVWVRFNCISKFQNIRDTCNVLLCVGVQVDLLMY